MSDKQPGNPFFKEGDKVTGVIGEGVTIKLGEGEFAAVDAIIRENQATINLIKEMGKQLVEQEGRMWETIHNFYPKLREFHCQFNFRDGILVVGEPVTPLQRDFVEKYGYVSPPFTMRAGEFEPGSTPEEIPEQVRGIFEALFGNRNPSNDEED